MRRTWRNKTAFIAALIVGVAAQLLPQLISGREPETEAMLWTAGSFPLMIVASCLLGFFAPNHPNFWAVTIVLGDFITGLLTARGGLNLLPVGLLLYVIYAVIYILSGNAGAYLHRRIEKRNRN